MMTEIFENEIEEEDEFNSNKKKKNVPIEDVEDITIEDEYNKQVNFDDILRRAAIIVLKDKNIEWNEEMTTDELVELASIYY
jgi:hypothetical protein